MNYDKEIEKAEEVVKQLKFEKVWGELGLPKCFASDMSMLCGELQLPEETHYRIERLIRSYVEGNINALKRILENTDPKELKKRINKSKK